TLGLMPDFSMADFIGGFFNPESQSQPFVQKNMSAHDACPVCGMTAGEFRRVGRVGCSNCYSYFADYMPGLIQRIHGNSRHTGKVPVRGEAKLAEKQKVVQLRQELQQAIAEENFERAAELRDSIRNLEQEGGTHA
ncbi:MAG: UvrB/UvrC motif-containing protein, partial [Peptococcaceae bacterium]|nr:UvrB/UvrC motif-containing protein [Peptococcaceae bacterium]